MYLVRAAISRAAGVTLGAAGAVVELLFLLVAVPLLVVPACRPAVGAVARFAADWERRRVDRFVDLVPAAGYSDARALRYLAVHTLVGGLGAGVVLLILSGAVAAPIMVWQMLTGGSIGDSDDPDGPHWTEPVAFVLVGAVLIFVTVQGLLAVSKMDVRLARYFLGPGLEEMLRLRVEALLDSRAAVVEAVTEERRRIERDLHDGVQQRLVALGLLLGRAGRTTDPARITELLRQAHEETGRTLLDLREVTARIYPVALDDGGLRAALESLAERSVLPVRLRYALTERYPAAVETPAWFVACEAVTNAIKHSGATRIDLEVERARRAVVVRICDDGRGGADPAGGGLSGLARRVAAVDGRFTVHSPSGGPTVITAEVPCG